MSDLETRLFDAPDSAVSTEPVESLAQQSLSPELAGRLHSLTPARVGLRRTGVSIATRELLDFQLAHARARDAVHAPLEPSPLLAGLRELHAAGALLLHSAAPDRRTYLQRPDLGRKLDEASRRRLMADMHREFEKPCSLAIVIADGLSALAVERHVLPLLADLLPNLAQLGPSFRIAPFCVVEQGRVAVGDEIAHALGAELVVMLIGERPGLSSPDSLGAYITWKPIPGTTTDAERNCISNIRGEGLSYRDAAARLAYYIGQARSSELTGVALKDPETAVEKQLLTTSFGHEEPSGAAS
jgi:ethanolamine ammonia-lyase small subunit